MRASVRMLARRLAILSEAFDYFPKSLNVNDKIITLNPAPTLSMLYSYSSAFHIYYLTSASNAASLN
jgi:hypothetical protein